MDFNEALRDLQHSLIKDPSGMYRLPCRKMFLKVRLLGESKPLIFTVDNHVFFRLDIGGLTIKRESTGAVDTWLSWRQIESLAAGEPESDNELLFQG
jgi:hypothetical protein